MSLILYNGKIRTGEGLFEQAVLCENGRIKAVGSNENILEMDSDAEKVDIGGRLVLPGFNDSHMHLVSVGNTFSQIDLRETKSIDEALNLCRAVIGDDDFSGAVQAGKDGKEKWIQCFGWNEDNWEEHRYLTREDLDKISTTRPVVAVRVCLHACTINSKGLELMGISESTPQPEGGGFDVDENGKPTGVLYEMLPQIYEKMGEPTVDDIKEIILNAGNSAASKGLTSVQTDDLRSLPGQNMKNVVEAYRELSEEGRMPVRVTEQCQLMTMDDYDEFIGYGYHSGQGNDTFKLGPLKTFCDGSLGARTAWLKEPYADDPENCGTRIYEDEEELYSLVKRAHEDGMPAAIHCIGDAGAEQAVTAIEKALAEDSGGDVRHGIVHAQILNKDLLERMKKDGIIAYIQPVFLEYDLHMAESRVGEERLAWSYPFRQMYDMGICTPFGTDCPVESFNPLTNIYCAVTGKDFDGMPEEGWHREKLLTVDEAVRCYSEYSAWASYEENEKGKIAPNYKADLTVLNEDIFEIPPEQIKDVQVFMTLMGGNITYLAKEAE